mgnify:CR=1 FL=1
MSVASFFVSLNRLQNDNLCASAGLSIGEGSELPRIRSIFLARKTMVLIFVGVVQRIIIRLCRID